MAKTEYILTELNTVAPALNGLQSMPYTVPEGYFNHLPALILNKAKATAVPEGYFENFADKMLQLVNKTEVETELQQIAPTLTDINKKPVYTVPDGYFENLIPQTEKAEVISIRKKYSWVKYAAAAMLILTLGFAGFNYFNKPQVITAGVNPTNVNLNMDVETELAKLDNSDINMYLNTTFTQTTEEAPDEVIEINNTTIDELLDTYDTEDLENYAIENSTDADM
jgi:hypothetical protein